MASEPDQIPPGEDIAAAELALGVLEGEDRAAAMRRVLAEPAFAQEVERWRAHFAFLLAEVPSVEPPAHVLGRVEAALALRGGIRRLVWPAIATALAASLIVALLLRPVAVPPPVASQPTLIATLDPAAKGAPIPAVYDAARGEIRIAQATLAVAGRSAELWLIGGDGVPQSLGLLAANGKSVVAVTPARKAALMPGIKLAISSEPQGGSPSGKPTGPILAIGTLISL